MLRLRPILIPILLVLLIVSIYYAYAYTLPKWFPFNKENALDEWEERLFKISLRILIQSIVRRSRIDGGKLKRYIPCAYANSLAKLENCPVVKIAPL